MATKLQELLEELRTLDRFYISINDGKVDTGQHPTGTIVNWYAVEKLITKYTETTPTKEIVYTEAEVEELFHQAGYYYDNNIVSPTEWFNQNRKEIS